MDHQPFRLETLNINFAIVRSQPLSLCAVSVLKLSACALETKVLPEQL